MAIDLPPHIQRWTMEILGREVLEARPTRSERSASNSSTPTFVDDDADVKVLPKIERKALMRQAAEEKEMLYHGRYLSSEESLPSPGGDDDSDSFKSFDDDENDDAEDGEEVDYDTEIEISQAAEVFIGRELAWKGELAATVVSVIFSGRPKVVEIPSPVSLSPVPSKTHSRVSSIDMKTPPVVEEEEEEEEEETPPVVEEEKPLQRARSRPQSTINNDDTTPSKRLSQKLSAWSAHKAAQPSSQQSPQRSASPARTEPRISSVYIPTTSSSPSRRFDPLRRKSIANADEILKKRDATPPPPLPIQPGRAQGHSRIKSLSRGLAMFNKVQPASNHRKAADGSDEVPSVPSSRPPTSASTYRTNTLPHHYAPSPPPGHTLARAATVAPSTTFAPAPFVRPNAAKLVARGADARDPAVSLSMLGPAPSPPRAVRDSPKAASVAGDSVPEMVRKQRDGRTVRVRKRTSILGF